MIGVYTKKMTIRNGENCSRNSYSTANKKANQEILIIYWIRDEREEGLNDVTKDSGLVCWR